MATLGFAKASEKGQGQCVNVVLVRKLYTCVVKVLHLPFSMVRRFSRSNPSWERRRSGARRIAVELGLRALESGMRRVGSLSGMGQRGRCRATRNPVLIKYIPFFTHLEGQRSGCVSVRVKGGYFKKSNFSNHVRCMG